MDFDQYLLSKKIDASAFQQAEPDLFKSWKMEFDQMHMNSFTVQKLNLINPIRRKYQLKEISVKNKDSDGSQQPKAATTSQPRITRPVIKPKID